MLFGFSKWFFAGIAALIIGVLIALVNRRRIQSKMLENGYLLVVLGMVGIFSEFTDLANTLFFIVLIALVVWKIAPKQTNLSYYTRDFVPILLVVWLIRAFIGEIYLIPSSSMRADLIPNDFVIVSKFSYGIRFPIINKVVLPISQIKFGDVVVFKDPVVSGRDLIKRVIGLPGDTIDYHDKKLTINSISATYIKSNEYTYATDKDSSGDLSIEINNDLLIESLNGFSHNVLIWDRVPTYLPDQVIEFQFKNNCKYDESGFTCKVPEHHYFMMGDNRDNSLDSRYWGFASDNDILGKAKIILANPSDYSRFLKVIK